MKATFETPLVIACAADANYALPLAVMLKSAFDALPEATPCEVYVVDDGMDALTRSKVMQSVPATVQVHWIQRPETEFQDLPNWGRMALTTYHKLTIGEWLPESVSQAIWIDCDTLVLRDLRELWQLDFGGAIALGVQDVVVPTAASTFGIAGYKELDIAGDAPYFNAGILVLDLVSWRKQGIGASAWDYLVRFHDRVYFWDQEALNAALAGKWKLIDSRWNLNPLMNRFILGKVADPEPWILHFTGNLKPWNYLGQSDYHTLYYAYLDKTAWQGDRPVATLRARMLAAYEASFLRVLLYPLERIQMRLVRLLTHR